MNSPPPSRHPSPPPPRTHSLLLTHRVASQNQTNLWLCWYCLVLWFLQTFDALFCEEFLSSSVTGTIFFLSPGHQSFDLCLHPRPSGERLMDVGSPLGLRSAPHMKSNIWFWTQAGVWLCGTFPSMAVGCHFSSSQMVSFSNERHIWLQYHCQPTGEELAKTILVLRP